MLCNRARAHKLCAWHKTERMAVPEEESLVRYALVNQNAIEWHCRRTDAANFIETDEFCAANAIAVVIDVNKSIIKFSFHFERRRHRCLWVIFFGSSVTIHQPELRVGVSHENDKVHNRPNYFRPFAHNSSPSPIQ